MYPAPERFLYTLTCIRRRRSIYRHLHVSGAGEVFIYTYMYPAPEKCLYEVLIYIYMYPAPEKYLCTLTCDRRRRSIYIHLHVSGAGEVFIYTYMYPASEKCLYTLTCIRRRRSVYMKCLYTFTCIWPRRSIYVHLHVSGVGEVFIYMYPAPEKCLYEVFIYTYM